MSAEANKAAARKHLDTILRNDYSALPKGMTTSFQAHAGGITMDRNMHVSVNSMVSTIGDYELTIHEQIAEGSLVATRLTWRVVHTGDFQGMPASGNTVVMDVIHLDRFEDGLLAETWIQGPDMEQIVQQLQ